MSAVDLPNRTVKLWYLALTISSPAAGLWSCSSFANPANDAYPLIELSEVEAASHERFNVRGFVAAVVVCPRGEMCLAPDGVWLSTDPVSSQAPDPEAFQRLREEGKTVFLMSDGLRRLRLQQGRRYVISYEVGRGVVGASLVE